MVALLGVALRPQRSPPPPPLLLLHDRFKLHDAAATGVDDRGFNLRARTRRRGQPLVLRTQQQQQWRTTLAYTYARTSYAFANIAAINVTNK